MTIADIDIMSRSDFKKACLKHGVIKGTDDIGKLLDAVAKMPKDIGNLAAYEGLFEKLRGAVKEYRAKHGKENPKFLDSIKGIEVGIDEFFRTKKDIDDNHTSFNLAVLTATTAINKASKLLDKQLDEAAVKAALPLMQEAQSEAGHAAVYAMELARALKYDKFADAPKEFKAATDTFKKIREALAAMDKLKKFDVSGSKLMVTPMTEAARKMDVCAKVIGNI